VTLPEAYDYRESHRDPSKPAQYDPKFFEAGTTLNLFWEIERTIISELLAGMNPRPQRALDFACGTGRVLSLLEELVPETVGVDISAPMLEIARKRCAGSRIIEADLTNDPDRVEGRFDVVSTFRFLLNAQPELRAAVLQRLRALLADQGLLVVNFHLNPRSLTGFYMDTAVRLRKQRHCTLTLRQADQILRENGFEPVSVRGYGYLFHRTLRVPLPSVIGPIERRLAEWNPAPGLALNFIVAARPIPGWNGTGT